MKLPDALPATLILFAMACFWLAGVAAMFVWRLLLSTVRVNHRLNGQRRAPGLLAATPTYDAK